MSLDATSENFIAVIDSHKGILWKVANAYCKDSEARKDLVQEMLIQLWRSFGRYDSQYQYSTWIYRIALNVAISNYRKELRRGAMEMPIQVELANLASQEPNTEQEQRLQILQGFIAELKELDKAIMLLYLEEKSHQEIAQIIGLTASNVGTRIGRIKAWLKQKFESSNKNKDGR